MAYQDRTLSCVQCGSEFTFSAEDQEFHARKGYQEPKRCPSCREARRGARGSYGGGYGGQRQMFDAVCDSCHRPTQVPFQPRQDRPVYCSDCFTKVRPGRSNW